MIVALSIDTIFVRGLAVLLKSNPSIWTRKTLATSLHSKHREATSRSFLRANFYNVRITEVCMQICRHYAVQVFVNETTHRGVQNCKSEINTCNLNFYIHTKDVIIDVACLVQIVIFRGTNITGTWKGHIAGACS